MSAIADDDDVAEVLIGEVESGKPPALEGWDGRDDALANIQDLLKSLLAALTGADLPPTRRPVTAVERLERRRREQKENNLLDQLLPGR
ncbi:hypothetical protein [Corynebacterium mustelae]|nr:hypothetical protein [Corynebacterium mustelae]